MADSSPVADAAASAAATTAPAATSPPATAPSSSSAFSASSSAPKASAHSLLSRALQPAAVDAFLLRLNKVMETPLGIDTVLATVCYSARLAAVVLSSAATGRALLHAPARQLATLVRLPDSTLVLLTGVAAPASASAAAAAASSGRAATAAKQLRALGSLMSEARLILRLWGLLSMYGWTRLLVKQLLDGTDRAKSATTRLIGWTQLLSCLVYQVYENGAYLAQRGVLNWSPAKQARAYRWSSRAFSVYVVVELARLVHDTAAAHRRPAAAKAATPEEAAKAAAQAAETVELHRSLARYVALAPVMAHYSVEKGFLGDASQAVLGIIPAALQMHKIWGETTL